MFAWQMHGIFFEDAAISPQPGSVAGVRGKGEGCGLPNFRESAHCFNRIHSSISRYEQSLGKMAGVPQLISGRSLPKTLRMLKLMRSDLANRWHTSAPALKARRQPTMMSGITEMFVDVHQKGERTGE